MEYSRSKECFVHQNGGKLDHLTISMLIFSPPTVGLVLKPAIQSSSIAQSRLFIILIKPQNHLLLFTFSFITIYVVSITLVHLWVMNCIYVNMPIDADDDWVKGGIPLSPIYYIKL